MPRVILVLTLAWACASVAFEKGAETVARDEGGSGGCSIVGFPHRLDGAAARTVRGQTIAARPEQAPQSDLQTAPIRAKRNSRPDCCVAWKAIGPGFESPWRY